MIKKIIPLLFVFISACSGKPTTNDDSPVNKFVADSTKHRLLKIINGGWVCKDYIDTFYRYHSFVLANGNLPVLQLVFDTSKVEGDTMFNGYRRESYSATERFDIVFRQESGKVEMLPRAYPAINFKMDELKYVITRYDTMLVLLIGNRNYIFEKVFDRIPEYSDGKGGSIKLNALDVFAYKSLSCYEWNNSKIKLKEDGTTSGFGSFTRFSVKTKANYPLSEPDEITFYSDTAGTTFAFRMREGEYHQGENYAFPSKYFDLFELREAKNGMEISRGKLLYEWKGVSIYTVTVVDSN